LQEYYGPVRATLILAPLWAGWHLPLFQMKGWSSAKPWQFLLILVGIGFLLTAAANISKFNVVVAIVLHAFFNTSSGLGNALTPGLPRRANEMMIYTLGVFIGGVVVGLGAGEDPHPAVEQSVSAAAFRLLTGSKTRFHTSLGRSHTILSGDLSVPAA
jgi:hypothetical protein